MQTRTISEWADFWRYEVGVNVIPANTKYKKPIVAWTEWQDRPIPKELHEQWKREKQFDNGMAIVAGKVWHNSLKAGLYLCAIDCDNKRAIEEIMPNGVITYAEKTLIELHPDDSTKCHIYFYTNNPVPKKSSDMVNPKQSQQLKNNEIPALEVKGDGKHGIMYVTPSMHKNGTRYEIIGVETPVILNEISVVIDRVCKKYGMGYLENVKNNSSLIPMNELLDDMAEIQEGHNRHLALLRYADSMYKTAQPGMTDKIIFEMLAAKNKIMCNPPLPDDDLPGIQEQAKNKVQEWKNIDSVEKKTKGKAISDYADMLMVDYNFVTMADTDEIFYYQEGVYVLEGEVLIKKQCEKMIIDCKRDNVNEVTAAIKRRTYVKRIEFDSEVEMLNLKNCWLNIETGETFPHTPTKLSKIQIPIFYDPEKIAWKFIKFLKQCIPKSTDAYTICEQFASCLIKSPKFGKAFMYVGQGSNGKSVFLNLIKKCLGVESISNISIHAIENNRFAPAELDGKLANIYADISNEELNTAGTFKNLVTGDPIFAEKKNKNPFSLVNFAKMFFSANQIPIVYDESDGFFRRFMIVEWNIKFTDKQANIRLIKELSTEDEKSGVLNIMIKMARNLDKRGYFQYADSVETLRNKWKNKADSIGGFLEKCLYYESDLVVEKKRLYDFYVKYCTDNKLYAKKRKDFQIEILHNSPLEENKSPVHINVLETSWYCYNKNDNGKSVRVWKGGMLKEDFRFEDKS